MLTGNKTKLAELVPIADRLRYMQIFRVVAVAATAIVSLLAGDVLLISGEAVAVACGAYLLLSGLSHGAWYLSRSSGLAVFGGMLIVDGLFLGWIAYVTGGGASPIRYFIVLHLIAVALLASYRTGMKLALWHSLLLLVLHYARDGELLAPYRPNEGIGTPFENLVLFSIVLWFTTIATSSLSAVNERELRRRRYDLEALSGSATRMETANDSAAVAKEMVDSIADTFDFERLVVIARREDNGEMKALAHKGAVDTSAEPRLQGERSALRQAQTREKTQLVTKFDPVEDAWLSELLPGAKNLVVVPLPGKVDGALIVEYAVRRGTRMERRLLEMLERFVSHGALALRNAWLLEDVQKLATIDGLTEVANRLTFDERLEHELDRAARGGDDVSLVMVDIDRFKQLNDNHGHRVGDQVLREVSRLLADTIRSFDTVARYGGEEFAVILPRTGTKDATMIAERLRAAIEGREGDPSVTISAGVATFPLDALNPDDLVGTADEALYLSKRTGRNKVMVARRSSERALQNGRPAAELENTQDLSAPQA